VTQSIVHHPFVVPIWPRFNLELTGFGLAMLLAFWIAQVVGESELRRRGQAGGADAMPDVTIGAVVGGLLGAKVYYMILTGQSFFSRAGFVFWGGLIGGIVVTALVIRWKKLPFARFSDVGALSVSAAYAVGRTGCWAVGDDYGRPWASRFAVSFPEGQPPSTVGNLIQQFGLKPLQGRPLGDVVAVYPTQLFEVTMALIMFGLLWRMRDHRHAEGWLFGVYCVMAGTERFIVEFFRAKDDRFFSGLTLAQVIAVAFVLAGVALMQMRREVRAGAPGIHATA
jgi:phosphatidylglycerol:prolipoprotein diacylglycerol transferase